MHELSNQLQSNMIPQLLMDVGRKESLKCTICNQYACYVIGILEAGELVTEFICACLI